MPSSDEDIIDFGGRFARQFCPVSSTPVSHEAASVCDSSGYESFVAQTAAIALSSSNLRASPSQSQAQVQAQSQAQSQQIQAQSQPQQNSVNIIQHCRSQSLVPQPLLVSLANAVANQNSPAAATPAPTASSLISSSAVVRSSQSLASNRTQRSSSLFTTTPSASLATTNNSFAVSNPWSSSSQTQQQRFTYVDSIERAASLHRTAASHSEPQYTWSGQLPTRSYKNPVYSCKVFLGGVPYDVTESGLIDVFGRYGPLRVQWPPKDARQQSGHNQNHNQNHHNHGQAGGSSSRAGYVYLVYESERYVKALLQACTQDFGAGNVPEKYYYRLSSRRMRFKEVQVIPWILADSNYIRNHAGRPDLNRTVFVGALHGMMTAEGLARIMNDLFGGVCYVGIDSDKHKYPIGSGRCSFNNQKSYMKAVAAAFIEVKSSQFNKKIQCDPYLNLSECSTCHVQNGPIFCRDCLRYFCKTCWNWHHSTESIIGRQQHHPMMRKKRET